MHRYWPEVDDLGGHFMPFSGMDDGIKYCIEHLVESLLMIDVLMIQLAFNC